MRSTREATFALTIVTIFAIGLATGQIYENNEIREFKNVAVKNVDYRLPTTVIPTSYEIDLAILDSSLIMNVGTVRINVTVQKATNEIVFHTGTTNITSAEVLQWKKKPMYTYDSFTDKYKIRLDSTIPAGTNVTLKIDFKSELKDNMIGFYRSSYFDKTGKLKFLAATQFHATHARHAFPCFDEPSLKATFTIRIRRMKEYRCLSNMPLVSTEQEDWYYVDTFATSVPMSTYLVAYVISDFSSLDSTDKNFTVWARTNAVNQAEYALKVGPQALKLFSSLFNQKYQLDKMDMVAIPDFAAGAMENWGLVTYRETRMLYKENESSDSSQQDIASVIFHECSHMWFGNLVTPKWWDYLWLSEGFARYYEYMGTAQLEPTWKMEQQFVVDQLQSVFAVDALDSSHPMTRNVASPAEIGTTGDAITYDKGASVIRMMELTFGSSVFNSALQEYLTTNKYSSATPEDLWKAFHRVDEMEPKIGASVETIMNTWTRQAGFPVLTVHIFQGMANLRQERFFLRNPETPMDNTIWWIPITWTTGKKPDFDSTSPKYWFQNKTAQIPIETNDYSWIVFNVREAGFYRVNYDQTTWYRIIDTLTSDRYDEIHEVNRAAIVDDLLNLARADLLDYDTALTGLRYIKRETNYLPFKAAFTGLEYLRKRFMGQPNNFLLEDFSLQMIEDIYNDLGYDDRVDDDRFTILLREEVNNLACKFNHQKCIERSQFHFNNWQHNSIPVPKNQRATAYCAAIKTGDSLTWDFLWEQYLNSNFASEQVVILKALGCSQDKANLEKLLLKAIDEFSSSKIRRQDSTTVFSAVYTSGLFGANFVLDFVATHHSNIATYYGGYDTVASILSGVAQHLSTNDLVDKFATLIRDNAVTFKTIEKSLTASLNLARYELKWYVEHQQDISTWMEKNLKDTAIPDKNTSTTTDYRLPTSILPTNYVIDLKPFIEPEDFTFTGSVEITAKVSAPTDEIVLHINELKISSTTATADGIPLEIMSTYEDRVYDFMIITVNPKLNVGTKLVVTMTYEGKLNKVMKGFYRSSYINDAGKRRWLAATHLEPVGARKMFPCFDEPAFKATFNLIVSTPKGYTAISNTPLKSVSKPDADGRVLNSFKKTPVMSTYLVAVVVSDFEAFNDTVYGAWARPNAVQQTEYAYSVMEPLVKHFEKAFGHSYQLQKLDMVALPDFSSGAMENWGLITYRETNMLYDPDYSPITSKQSIANVISHEISHQWFGNLVTPKWWKYLWLSESFARYFQYYGTANVETEWGLESQFVVEQVHSAFAIDASSSSHPMSHDVYSPSEISGIFDSISYNKGASVLRMFEKTFGSDIFYGALNEYLESRQYMEVTPEHLFEAFQKTIDSNDTKLETTVKTIMDTWTTQAGVPVVNVKIDGTEVSLNQTRFFLNKPDNLTNDDLWWIPITWTSKSNPNFVSTSPKYWLSTMNGGVKLEKADEWVIFNVQQSGYYRVNYDVASWNRIIDVLKSKDFANIHELNRASIMDDLLILGQAGQVDYETVLSATQYLSQETNYIPWRAAFNDFVYLNHKFEGKPIYELYKAHMMTILRPVYEKLGFAGGSKESHYDKLLRRYVVDWMCKYGDESCIESALDDFYHWKTSPTELIAVDVRNTFFCIAMRNGTSEDWDFLWEKYVTGTVTTEKVVILNALGCTTNTTSLEKLLKNAITENSPIRLQDSTSAFSAAYSSGLLGAEYTLDFIAANLKDIYKYYGDYNKIASILKGLSSRFNTDKLILKFEEFVNTHETELESIHSSLNEYLVDAREQLNWYDRNSPKIFKWLDENYGQAGYRLPKNIYPESYVISLTPFFEENNFAFNGNVSIVMNVLEDTSSIVLHANKLNIDDVKVYIDGKDNVEVLGHSINETTHLFTIYLKTTVPAGTNLTLDIAYTGLLNDEMKGFYRSSYIDQNGTTQWLATTKFEPVYARMAFPCFDEPAFKAKYEIHIERPNDYHSLSNMPKINTHPSKDVNRTWDSYKQSVYMSSYLVAFVVSKFEPIRNTNGNFSVWARPEAVEHASYALNIGEEVMKFLENYTNIDYPIGKMDFVAVPDFPSGAMENWGLITFREYGLLYHDDVESANWKKYVNTIVSHELVHMWFGNLVTCEWWNYIWLQEGFAQYLQWIAADSAEPEWKLLQQFVSYELHAAMEVDASPTTRAMNHDVTKPSEIVNSFDTIAYGKSASVIRMLHHALGAKVFESGIHHYLDSNRYGIGKPTYLWASMQVYENEENSLGDLNVSIETLMDGWTNNAGYPVVKATWVSGALTLTQERFLLPKPKEESSNDDPQFWIPITLTTQAKANFSNTRPDFWFDTKRYNLPLFLTTDEWFIVNIQETGYYRVNYDTESWKRLANGLKAENFDGIHEINRAQIVDDLFNLARGGYVDYDLALRTTKYLENEDNHLPWKAFFNAVTFLRQRFGDHDIGDDFAAYVLGLLQRIYEKVGFDDVPGEEHLQQLNRQLILTWACKFGHSHCVERSVNYFTEWREDETKRISPNAKQAVYCTAIKEGNYKDWEFLWQQYEKTKSPTEKVDILVALGCSRNVRTLKDYLARAISSDKAIRDQDVARVFSSVYTADSFGVDTMLDFLIENHMDLYKYYDNWDNVANLFSAVASRISNNFQRIKFAFFVRNSETDLPEISASLKSALEVVTQNFNWYDTHKPTISLFLEEVLVITETTESTSETSETTETSETSETSETTETSETSETSETTETTEITAAPNEPTPKPDSSIVATSSFLLINTILILVLAF